MADIEQTFRYKIQVLIFIFIRKVDKKTKLKLEGMTGKIDTLKQKMRKFCSY